LLSAAPVAVKTVAKPVEQSQGKSRIPRSRGREAASETARPKHGHADVRAQLIGKNLVMGSWGVGIFSNDDAADIRDDFRDLIADGLSVGDATRRLQEKYGVGGRGTDDNDFWLGLAAAQHSTGHVSSEVIDRAITIIDSPSELDRWEPANRNRRKVALDKLRAKLLQPPPQPKRLRPRPKVETRLEPGQHVVAPVRDREVVLRVTRIHDDKGGRCPVVVVLDWDNDERKLRKAHRLPAALNPSPKRED
jgi:hypothetical protein